MRKLKDNKNTRKKGKTEGSLSLNANPVKRLYIIIKERKFLYIVERATIPCCEKSLYCSSLIFQKNPLIRNL